MQLTVLVDNNTLIDRYYLGEPGVAYYLEDGDVRILFDVGYSDIFLRNAQALGIDLSRLQQVVLSHGHNDHTRGLLWLSEQEYFSELQLLAHPAIKATPAGKNAAVICMDGMLLLGFSVRTGQAVTELAAGLRALAGKT